MLLAERRPSGEWSVVENVRHLLFAERLYLGRFLPDGFTWSGLPTLPRERGGVSNVDSEPAHNV